MLAVDDKSRRGECTLGQHCEVSRNAHAHVSSCQCRQLRECELQELRATAIASCRSIAVSTVTQAASPHTHLAFPTSYAPCLSLKWLASVAVSNATRPTTTRNVYDFIAADILARRPVFITTVGPTTPTRLLSLLPGYPLLDGYPGVSAVTASEKFNSQV